MNFVFQHNHKSQAMLFLLLKSGAGWQTARNFWQTLMNCAECLWGSAFKSDLFLRNLNEHEIMLHSTAFVYVQVDEEDF